MTLYVVPTPIGNLEDITLRALRVLKEVSVIAAEDTRTTRILLDRYQITTRLTSYHEHNKHAKLEALFDLLAIGDVALVSDAGTPGISDPGYELIHAAIQRGVPVVVLPGANAVTTALVGSGLPTESGYLYVGFLPRKEKALHEFLARLKNEPRTWIAYESPNRLVETLIAIQTVLGERPVCVARELTKLHEELRRGTLSEVITHFQGTPPRGEITLVVGGAPPVIQTVWSAEQVTLALTEALTMGESRKDAARRIAELAGWSKRDVYNLETTGFGDEHDTP
jgi:16S rRNA (cytidine1402-2'-O)-methyltransferase